MKVCTKCKFAKSINQFYKSKTHSQGVMCYCKDCFNRKAVDRWIKRKQKAVHYKGSQCVDCRLHLSNSHYSVFEFHHVESSTKDYDWTKLRLKSWDKILMELNKCILLCANCHRVRHSRLEEFAEFDNIPQAVSRPMAPNLKADALSN